MHLLRVALPGLYMCVRVWQGEGCGGGVADWQAYPQIHSGLDSFPDLFSPLRGKTALF